MALRPYAAQRSRDRRTDKALTGARPTEAGALALPARWVLGLFVGALAIRLAVIAQLHGTVLFQVLLGDGRQYDVWARQIAGGQWMGSEVFYQTPLYPYALAVLYSIAGHHLLLVRLVQVTLGAGSCALVAVAGARFFAPRAGLAAGFLLAVCGPAVFFDVVVQKSSTDLFLASVLLALLGLFLRKPGWGWLTAAGVTTALFMINRENARVFYPVIVVWLLAGPWTEALVGRVRWVAVFTAAMAATLLPVGLRNYHVGGEFLVSTSQLGPNFYMGNHAGASGIYEPLVEGRGDVEFERADAERLARAATGRALTPSEVSDFWFRRGLTFVREQPIAWLELMAKKAAMTMAAAEVADSESIEGYAEYSSVLRVAARVNFGVLLPLAVLGVWMTRRDWRRLFVLYLGFAAMAAAVAAFYVMARYRYPLVPIAALFAGSALAQLPRLGAGTAGQTRWVVGAMLAAIVAVCSNGFLRETNDATDSNVGVELTRAGRSAEAIPWLERAVAAVPEYAPGHYNLGVTLNEIGDKARALDQFRAAVTIKPDYFEAQAALALALAESGHADEALSHFEAAVRLNPDSPEARCNLGQALVEAGQWPRAVDEFTQALARRPDYAKAHGGLGAALLGSGKTKDAIAHFERATTLAPRMFELQFGLGQAYARDGRISDAIGSFEKARSLAESSGRMDVAAQIQDVIRRLR